MTASLFALDGQHALVTGAGANGGIGFAIARGLAAAGVRLFLADRDAAGLAAAERQLREMGAEVAGRVCDVAEEAEVEALFAWLDGHTDRLDLLVNVPFAFPSRARPHELSLAAWRTTLEVSLGGYFLCCRAALRRMLPRHQGAIINVGSNAGVSALGRGASAYSCAKAGVHQLTRELAVEYAAAGIRVNAIVPAQTLTPGLRGHLDNPEFKAQVLPRILAGIPLGRLLEPEDMVGPTLFLASPAAAAVTGVLLPVDGGNLALNAGGG